MLAGGVFAAIVTAFVLFAATNADDIVILTVLNFSARRGGRPRGWQIWAGQYAGFTILVAFSMAAAAGLAVVPSHWLWPLGLVPLGIGLVKLAAAIRAHGNGTTVSPAMAGGLTGVMMLTIVNGADNVSVYTPVFRTSSLPAIMVTIAVFMAGTGLYCLAGSRFSAHGAVAALIGRWGQWIVPAVFMGIGVYIFGKTGLPG